MSTQNLQYEQYILKPMSIDILSDLILLGDLAEDYGFTQDKFVKVTASKGRIVIELNED